MFGVSCTCLQQLQKLLSANSCVFCDQLFNYQKFHNQTSFMDCIVFSYEFSADCCLLISNSNSCSFSWKRLCAKYAIYQSRARAKYAICQSRARAKHAICQSRARAKHAICQSRAQAKHAMCQSRARAKLVICQSSARAKHAICQSRARAKHAICQSRAHETGSRTTNISCLGIG